MIEAAVLEDGVGGRGERGGREGGPENIPEEEEEGESRAKSPPCCGSEELKYRVTSSWT